MINKENLLRARSNIVFILALLVGFALVMWIERHSQAPVAQADASPAKGSGSTGAPAGTSVRFSSDVPALPAPRPLTAQEQEWARIAWTYFENNTDARTGLVNSVDNYPAATMWDTGSYLLGLIAAHRLQLVTAREFNTRVSKVLDSLARMPLFDGALPNKSYGTRDVAMVDYAGKPVPNGIGWSALDVCRLLVPLNILVWNYPSHSDAARRVVARWDVSQLARDGVLYGAAPGPGNQAKLFQEGRLGYEQYGAKAAGLIGLDVAEALDYRARLAWVDIGGIDVPHDTRDARTLGAHNYVLSEPYVLDGLEFGWDRLSREFAWRVYRAQENRYAKTGVLTAVSEDHVDQAPYFIYNTVFANGKAWNAMTEQGEDASRLRTLSVKAAFGWHALYRSDYTGKLMEAAASLFDPQRGWYAGRYEEGGAPNKAITANTNAIVLESLAFTATGRLLGYQQEGKP